MRTKKGEVQRFFEEIKDAETDDCIIWPYWRVRGYGRLGNGQLVTRVLCRDKHGPPPSKWHDAAHSCGNCSCVNWKHLSWKTRKENMADQLVHGTRTMGEQRYNAKVTSEMVREIRENRGYKSQRELGRKYNLSHTVIGRIQMGLDWAHIKERD